MKIPLRQAASCATGILGAAVIAACDVAPEVTPTGAELPLSAEIGNIATAELRPAGNSTVEGMVTFAQVANSLRIDVAVMGIAPGAHGVHIHENGDCSAPDASSAGGHWSPDGNPHGAPTDAPGQHHAGDLGNMTAGADGKAKMTREDAELGLVGAHGVVGHAVIVHSGPDDLQSQPGGNSGDRIACGVIAWGSDSEPG